MSSINITLSDIRLQTVAVSQAYHGAVELEPMLYYNDIEEISKVVNEQIVSEYGFKPSYIQYSIVPNVYNRDPIQITVPKVRYGTFVMQHTTLHEFVGIETTPISGRFNLELTIDRKSICLNKPCVCKVTATLSTRYQPVSDVSDNYEFYLDYTSYGIPKSTVDLNVDLY